MTRLIVFLAVVVLTHTSLFSQFGRLGRILDTARQISDMDITEEDEIALGEEISRRIREAYGVQQDEEATRYVTLVGMAVAEKTQRPHLPYQFIILDSDSTNALAAPGGFIHITRGALGLMKDEAELAGVLGHEIAHITNRHTVKAIQKFKGIELADGQTSLTGDSAVFQKVAEKATEAIMQGFGRSEELEADEDGIRFAAQCGYHPSGLPEFLESLQTRYESREQRAGLFASHPQIKERLEKLQRQLAKEKLAESSDLRLADRFASSIDYETPPFGAAGATVAGARGLAETEAKEPEEEEEKAEERQERSRGLLARMRDPMGSGGGQREERREVAGAAAARGVETELGWEEAGDPKLVAVLITPEELKEFKEKGGLK